MTNTDFLLVISDHVLYIFQILKTLLRVWKFLTRLFIKHMLILFGLNKIIYIYNEIVFNGSFFFFFCQVHASYNILIYIFYLKQLKSLP